MSGNSVNLYYVTSAEDEETNPDSLEHLLLPSIALDTILSLYLNIWSSLLL